MIVTTRNHKVHCSYGANQYFSYYIKHGGKLDRHVFGQVLKDLNHLIADNILSGYSFKMPSRMGVLSVTKNKEFISIKDDKVVTNRPIDFKSTLDMWRDYPETKETKQIVRHLNKHSNGYIYRVAYNKGYATFKNKSVFNCRINRYLKRKLAQNIFNGFELEALVERPRYTNNI